MRFRHSHISDEIASRAPRALRQAADIEPTMEPAGDGYVTIAVGRDYADVAPLSGTFVATTPTSHLSVRKRLGQAA